MKLIELQINKTGHPSAKIFLFACCTLLLYTVSAQGQYVSADTYTRYELLAPETNSFRIFYEVTESSPGARFHFNIIRPGSEASDEAVYDLATGKPLKFEVVTGAQAKTDSPSGNFNPTAQYIKVHLAHPVPARGEYRLRIDKTYKDKQSYYADGDRIVFKRGLGIPRNSVVLPTGYEIVSSSVAAQVILEPDGRLKLAFVNPGSGGQLEVEVVARRLPASTTKAEKKVEGKPVSPFSGQPTATTKRMEIVERANQDLEILYELSEPPSHAFRITHDYTERREGMKHYFNVVRTGSRVSDPESIDLDSGENLKWETLRGKQIKERKLPLPDVKDDAEVVVTFFAQPVARGTSVRLRLKETYTDPKSCYLDGDELIWDRTFGRLRNTVVLPPGWYLAALESPATIQTLSDGRVSVYIVNPRNDDVRVYLRARRRAAR
ncbi:MAG: hypothetical protein MOB07_03605 [Acidobacteria bacterium]|nr:hypothetical protein [Acidobacteriota bacterium]